MDNKTNTLSLRKPLKAYFPTLLPAILLILSAPLIFPEESELETTIQKVKMAMLCMQRHSWEQGTAMQAMIETGDREHLLLMAREAVSRKSSAGDGRLSMVGSDFNIADPAVNGRGVLEAYRITGDESFRDAARGLYEFYLDPATKNASGVIYHNTRSKVIFSDNMFMVAPFMAKMGDYEEAINQIEGIRRVLWNPDKKLFHHMRIEETGEFKDEDFWGGGNGWCAAAMAQVIPLLPQEYHTEKLRLIRYYKELLDGCLAHQLPSGLFYDNITEPNFEETTMAAMLAYSIYLGLESGWLEDRYRDQADRMRAAVHAKVDSAGLVQGASAAPRFNSPGTSPEGQAFFLMMEGTYNRLQQPY